MKKATALSNVRQLAMFGYTTELKTAAMGILLDGKTAFKVDEYTACNFCNSTYHAARDLLAVGCEWERVDADGLPCETILAPDNEAVYVMTCKGARGCYSAADFFEM